MKKEKENKVKKEPEWKKEGFKSRSEFDEWYNEVLDDIRHGYM